MQEVGDSNPLVMRCLTVNPDAPAMEKKEDENCLDEANLLDAPQISKSLNNASPNSLEWYGKLKAIDAESKHSTHIPTLMNRALYLSLLSHNHKAIEQAALHTYERVLKFNDNYPSALYQYALTLSSAGKIPEAIRMHEKILEKSPIRGEF